MSNQTHICLILLVGIPASGKSFFQKYLENHIYGNNKKNLLGSVNMCSVCYDNFDKVRNPTILSDGEKWRKERLKILKLVENIIIYVRENNLVAITDHFYNISVINESIKDPNCTLLLIDDNMYYRSMRYEYFKLARTYSLSFCQIFLEVSLEDAVESNKTRCKESQIHENIIKVMFDKIEPPSKIHSWEKYSINISSHKCIYSETVLNDIFLCIQRSLSDPVKPIEICSKKEEACKITKSNCLHQIDNILKRLVGILIKSYLKDGANNKPQALSQYYSVKRLNLLKQIKEGKITMPFGLETPTDSVKVELLKQFLLDLLKN